MLGRMDQKPAAEPLSQEQVQGLKHFQRLLPFFARLNEVGCQRDKAGNRQLFFDDYCALVTLYLLNPLIGSVRVLQQALSLPNVAKKLGIQRFSLGSFSEAPAVFEPQRLQAVIQELGAQLRPLSKDPRLSDLKHALTLVDSTVLSGLPRLAAAAGEQTHYNTARDGRAVYGWRMHLQLDLATFTPRRVTASGARNSGEARELNVLRRTLEAGRCYVGDGGYGDRLLFDEIVDAGSSYAVRMRENTLFEVIEERLLSQAALDAGVVRDTVVKLGAANVEGGKHLVRLVEVQVKPHPQRRRRGEQQTDRLLIATSLLDLPAELIALIYLHRYTVELFFRFLKGMLGMRHLLSQRAAGAEIQIYCAVIACMLISLESGRRPSKYMVTMLGWYLLGLASEQDVIDFLNQPDNTGVKKRAKDALWDKLGVK
jgi:hypothetical protein